MAIQSHTLNDDCRHFLLVQVHEMSYCRSTGSLWMSHSWTCAHVTGADAAEDEEVDVTTVDPIVAFCSR